MPPKPLSRKPVASPSKAPSTVERGFFGLDALELFLYGPPGVGKTTFASCFPNAGFVIDSQEQGIRRLVRHKIVPSPVFIEEVESHNATLDMMERIAMRKTGIQTAVFDSTTGFENYCFKHTCNEKFDGDFSATGFFSYYAGPENSANTDWPDFLMGCRNIVNAGINVIVLAHSKIDTAPNPTGIDYQRFTPALDKRIWAKTSRWAEAILFYNHEFNTEQKKGATKAKVVEQSVRRVIHTSFSPVGEAKNQMGLPPIIDGGDSHEEAFENFKQAVLKGK